MLVGAMLKSRDRCGCAIALSPFMIPTIAQDRCSTTVNFHVRGIDFTDELHDAVQKLVVFAVDRYETQVAKVSVYLTDLNGPKGGVDKLCQITANLRRGNPVFMLEKGSDLLTTVNRAARRIGHLIGRTVQRRNRADSQTFRKSIRVA